MSDIRERAERAADKIKMLPVFESWRRDAIDIIAAEFADLERAQGGPAVDVDALAKDLMESFCFVLRGSAYAKHEDIADIIRRHLRPAPDVAKVREALRSLANLPVERVSCGRSGTLADRPDQEIYTLDGATIFVRDVFLARAALKTLEGEVR